MNCLECQELLQKRMDGAPVAVKDELEHHLHECANCRDLHAAAGQFLDAMPLVPAPTLPAGFAERLTERIVRDRQQRRDKMGRRLFVTAALAASVLLMLFAAYWWFPRPRSDEPSPKPPLVEINPKPKAPPPKVAPKRQEKLNPLEALTARVADTTRDHAKVMLVATNLDAVEKLPAVNDIPMLDPGVREAGQEVSDGVRTVTRSARRAIDFFARELPMPELGDAKN